MQVKNRMPALICEDDEIVRFDMTAIHRGKSFPYDPIANKVFVRDFVTPTD